LPQVDWASVAGGARAELILLAGARELLAAHQAALPQRDDLCGAFCGALALHAGNAGQAAAAGAVAEAGEVLDQDAVALAAGSVVSRLADSAHLPHGEGSRRDYRLALPLIEDGALSGTTAAGLVRAIDGLSGGALAAIPYAGPWSAETLSGLFEEVLAELQRPVSVVANIATRHLWGSRASAAQLLAYLLDGELQGPAPDWDVGHFVCVFASVRGRRGRLYCLADTYPSLGSRGVHLQPQERLALALRRPGMAAGGMVVVVGREDAAGVRAASRELGLEEEAWDNGSVMAQIAAGAPGGDDE
jgi:hypothetical protein